MNVETEQTFFTEIYPFVFTSWLKVHAPTS
jgi:hypothetical protein